MVLGQFSVTISTGEQSGSDRCRNLPVSGKVSNVKVLGIMGSPRRQSNTEILLDRALEGAKGRGAEVEKVVVSQLKVAPFCFADIFLRYYQPGKSHSG